jgi:hypothetical protein
MVARQFVAGQCRRDEPVPEGLSDRSQAIYCLVFRAKTRTVPSGRYDGSARRATVGTIKQPGVRISLSPTGRILD